MTVLKGLKIITLQVLLVWYEFLKYGGSEVRNKSLKIINMIFEKGNYLAILEIPLLNHFIRKVIRVSVVIIEALVRSM